MSFGVKDILVFLTFRAYSAANESLGLSRETNVCVNEIKMGERRKILPNYADKCGHAFLRCDDHHVQIGDELSRDFM